MLHRLCILTLITIVPVLSQAAIPFRLAPTANTTPYPNACIEQALLKALTQHSHGQLALQNTNPQVMGNTSGTQLLIHNKADIGIVFAADAPESLAALNITQVPFTVENDTAILKALDAMRPSFQRNLHPSLRLQSVLLAGQGVFGSKSKTPIASAQNLIQKPIITLPSALIATKLLGAHAQAFPSHVLSTQFENPNANIWFASPAQNLTSAVYQHTNAYFYSPNFHRPVVAILVNQQFYQKLPPALQTAIDAATNLSQSIAYSQCFSQLDHNTKQSALKDGALWNEASPQDIETIKALIKPSRNMTLEMLTSHFNIPAKPLYAELMQLQHQFMTHRTA